MGSRTTDAVAIISEVLKRRADSGELTLSPAMAKKLGQEIVRQIKRDGLLNVTGSDEELVSIDVPPGIFPYAPLCYGHISLMTIQESIMDFEDKHKIRLDISFREYYKLSQNIFQNLLLRSFIIRRSTYSAI